jgi:NADP-dependent 3-hydroxy acid dehydrogenase YdfG
MDLATAKHAFITGGASGIGLGVARALAECGIAVTIVDVSKDNLSAVLSESPANMGGHQLDVRDRAAWARVKVDAEAANGPVDILMNNAGISPSGFEIFEMDPAHFDQIVAINLTGVFNGISTFAADMRARGSGHIVNTASMAGISVMPHAGGYVASKFGVVGLSEAARVELEPHGVGVSTFCPGQVATSLMSNTLKLGGPPTRFSADYVMTGLSPAEAAAAVLRGIEENAPYILTDPQVWRPAIDVRIDALRKAFDDGA